MLPAYKRVTKQAETLIAGAYLAGTNTRRVQRALAGLFGGAVGKDTVSRAWRKVQSDWAAWQKRDLAGDDIVRLILDGTVVRVRLDSKTTSLSILVALGVRRDGQKALLALRNMGGESEAAWRALLDDMIARGLAKPELLIIDGPPELEKALAAPVARPADPALHRPQAPQPAGPCVQETACRDRRRLHRHDLRADRAGGGRQAQSIPAQVAPQMPRSRRQPGVSRRATLRLPALSA
jgi:hypothetical protein